MKQGEIIQSLKSNHSLFLDYIKSLTNTEFECAQKEKWSAGQQLEHIYRSVKPLSQGLLLPKFIIKLVFGKANRPSLSYEELVSKYQMKLQKGGRATGRFVPKEVVICQKQKLIQLLKVTIDKLSLQLTNFAELDLDTIILPHPLFGKITLREMMYFTIYHVKHHHEIIKRDLAK